jgi:DNA-directed RNA polymerase specialized sigma24 family protein
MTVTLHRRESTTDYQQVFAASAEPLRWLCYTLTGDEELADRILDAALEQSLKGADHVFRNWMLSWARRLIIKVCIEAVRPSALASATYWHRSPTYVDSLSSDLRRVACISSETLQERLLHLDPLSRFVFVLRAVEGQSRRETALLLNIDDRACESIYIRTAAALNRKEGSPEVCRNAAHSSDALYHLAHAAD